MADSRRLQFFKNLETNLKDITIVGGYNEDVFEVSRKFQHWTQTKNFIRINVLPQAEQITPDAHREGVQFSDPLGFRLLSYVKAGADPAEVGLLSDKIENHIADVKKRIYTDPIFGLDFIEETEIDLVDAFFAWEQHIGVVIIEGHVAFNWVGTNP